MARPLRIEYPGAVYHLTARGNRQEAIFQDEEDRLEFLVILNKTVHRYNWICHAYCLMDNHYHLLVETLDANLSFGMRQLNGMYTQYFNRRHSKVGHVFQGRYKSIVVEKDAHLLELCRYIVVNPVRAMMTDHPGKWPWSSYNPTSTGTDIPDFLTVDWILIQFAKQKEIAKKRYIEFTIEGYTCISPLKKITGQTLLGGERFIKEMQGYLEHHTNNPEIPTNQRLASRPRLPEVIPVSIWTDKPKRNIAIAEASLKYGYTLKEIADLLHIHYTTVSKVVTSCK